MEQGMTTSKNYIIFDLEWNQPIEKKPKKERKLQFEIIEIGAVRMNEKREILDTFHELVRPQVYHEISWHTQKMLKLKKGELKKGDKFPAVYKRFLKWCGKDPIFCTWGSQDLSELQKNISYYKLKPLSEKPLLYYNVQKLFAIWQKEENISKSLEAAIDILEIPKEIAFHRADSDAYYTAKIFAQYDEAFIKNNYTFDLYHIPGNKKEEILLCQEKECWYVSRGFEEKTDITANRKIMAINCMHCNMRSIRPKVRWFTTSTKIFYAAAVCELHGPIKARLKIRKDKNNLYYADKLLTYITEEELLQLKEKKKAGKKHSSKKTEKEGDA